jgi:hypothetical protein
MIKSINHATNLSTQLANITSTGRLSSPPVILQCNLTKTTFFKMFKTRLL